MLGEKNMKSKLECEDAGLMVCRIGQRVCGEASPRKPNPKQASKGQARVPRPSNQGSATNFSKILKV